MGLRSSTPRTKTFSIPAHAPRILRSPKLDTRAERLAAVATLARLRLRRAGWMFRQAVGLEI